MNFSPLPAFVLGFHGCHRAVADRVVSRRAGLKASDNEYDWLGHGIYFSEIDPARAMQWAREQASHARSKRRVFNVECSNRRSWVR